MSIPTFLSPPTFEPASDEQVQMAAVLAAAETAGTPATPTERRLVGRKRVLVETAFTATAGAGVTMDHIYGREALRDSLLRGEAPMSSHVLYSQTFVLDAKDPSEREIRDSAAASWLPMVERVIVYVDRGVSDGMRATIDRARSLGVTVEERNLASWKRG